MIRTAYQAEISPKDLTSAGLRARFRMDESNAQYQDHDYQLEAANRAPRDRRETASFASQPSMARSELAYHDLDNSKLLYKWAGLLLSMLIKRRDYYSGDLDLFIIHMVLILGEMRALNAAADASARNTSQPIADSGVNVQSLSDITRIPRESVRRKLTMLIDSGLVRRSPDRLLYPGPASDMKRFFEDLSPLLREGSRPS